MGLIELLVHHAWLTKLEKSNTIIVVVTKLLLLAKVAKVAKVAKDWRPCAPFISRRLLHCASAIEDMTVHWHVLLYIGVKLS